MVDFWSNHLNVANPSDSVWDSRQHYDRAVIRANAMGKFSTMLAASAAHPAMLNYLNQADSTKYAPNENTAARSSSWTRSVSGAGYTEAMVLDSARIMTGYTLQWDDRHPATGSSGTTSRSTGPGPSACSASPTSTPRRTVAPSRRYIEHLAHHPATAAASRTNSRCGS